MRDFSYKMQQMRDFRCKKHGREPGRPKKKHAKKIKNCQLNFAPEKKEGRNKGKKEGRREGGRNEGRKKGKGKKKLNNFFLMLSSSLISPSLGGSRKNISRSKKN